MMRVTSSDQISVALFDWSFQNGSDVENRWVKMARCMPWDTLSETYHANMNQSQGRPALKMRVVIGALFVKHKLVLSDREIVGQIQENPYMRFFIGLESYTCENPFDVSLFVSIPRRIGQEGFGRFSALIVDELLQIKSCKGGKGVKRDDDHDDQPPTGYGSDQKASDARSNGKSLQGKLLPDATVVDQAIRFPTDISLLNEAREFSEQIIDHLFHGAPVDRKPRSYRQKARHDFLDFTKRRRPTKQTIRKAREQQLQYLRRNLLHIETLLNHFENGQRLPMPNWLLRRYWVIPYLYIQQKQMHEEKVNRCDNCIVSISPP